jgi:hypothetical protein
MEHFMHKSFSKLASSLNSNTRYAYTERECDPAIELHYDHTRFCDPVDGQFINEEPIAAAGGNCGAVAPTAKDADDLKQA